MSATIFISHSAKDPEARTYLDAVVEGLGASQFDVWLDQLRLKGGENWGVVIANLMAECHGAIALFSTKALESAYFKFEVSNLFARWMRENQDAALAHAQRFRFVPLVIPPLTVDDVKKESFVSAIYLGTTNWIVPSSTTDALTAIHEAFDTLTGWPSPLEALEANAAEILARINSPAVHRDAARYAGFSAADMGSPADYPTRLARLYLRCPIDRLCASLRRLESVLDDKEVLKLFDLLAPSWVSFEAGRCLEPYLCVTGHLSPENRFAVISGEYSEFTPLMYLLRARLGPRAAGHVVPVTPPSLGDRSEAWLLGEVESELTGYIRRYWSDTRSAAVSKELARLETSRQSGDRKTFEPLLKTFINRLVLGGGAVVVVVPVGPADFDLVEAVSAKPGLEQVTFIALRGREHPPPGAATRVIVPEASPEYEDLAYNAFVGFTGA